MLNIVDRIIDRITMYRLLLYFLIALLVVAVVVSAAGLLHFSPAMIVLSAVYLSIVCGVTNAVFAWIFKAPANFESSYITALILALIITPPAGAHGFLFLTAAGGLAMASKYILNIGRQHIFNPAAIAVVLTAIAANQSASWWVGSAQLWPLVVLGGLLIMRKIQREQMVLSFVLAALFSSATLTLMSNGNVLQTWHQLLLNSSIWFLGFVMLTEPLTSPARRKQQVWYGALVGLLFPPQIHIGSLYSTPELALIIGNAYTYMVAANPRLLPKLKQKLKLAPDIMDFVFTRPEAINYLPGQYMEWTLPHTGADSRGMRRYFTLASSPTENDLRLGVKFYQPGSSFKKALLSADGRTAFAAGLLGGDFVMPDDPSRKLAFIAGGIGVTPYRSMIKYLLDTGQKRSVVLLYAERDSRELVYTDVFESARQQLGVNTTYVVDSGAPAGDARFRSGRLDGALIAAEMPDFRERLFYISGPPGMVEDLRRQLSHLGVHRSQIKTDLFTGYA